jgi:hypothetical protein
MVSTNEYNVKCYLLCTWVFHVLVGTIMNTINVFVEPVDFIL